MGSHFAPSYTGITKNDYATKKNIYISFSINSKNKHVLPRQTYSPIPKKMSNHQWAPPLSKTPWEINTSYKKIKIERKTLKKLIYFKWTPTLPKHQKHTFQLLFFLNIFNGLHDPHKHKTHNYMKMCTKSLTTKLYHPNKIWIIKRRLSYGLGGWMTHTNCKMVSLSNYFLNNSWELENLCSIIYFRGFLVV